MIQPAWRHPTLMHPWCSTLYMAASLVPPLRPEPPARVPLACSTSLAVPWRLAGWLVASWCLVVGRGTSWAELGTDDSLQGARGSELH